jgi:tyrosyl-tRNA synthetase
MSKSLGNTIGITDAPEEMYGKTMSLSDAVMLDYFDLLASGEWHDLAEERQRLAAGRGDPLAFKHALAGRLVERLHGAEAAQRAAEHFRRVVQGKEVPEEVPEACFEPGEGGERGLLELMVAAGIARSNADARRLVAQKAVSLDGAPVGDATLRLGVGSYLLRVGKRRYCQIRIG